VTTDAEGLCEPELLLVEREANVFAGHAAAPQWLLNHALRTTFGLTHPLTFIRASVYCFEVKGIRIRRRILSFQHLCQVVARYIQPWFGGLSAESISYRLQNNDWLLNGGIPTQRFAVCRIAS
jgi:hypothetical protein